MPTPMLPTGARPRPRHRMIDRVAEILEHIARRPGGVNLSELARLIDAPLSSVQGLTNGLVATGYLDERDRIYTLGPAPYFLTRLAGSAPADIVTHADLQEIFERTGVTTVLSVVVGPDLYYIDHASTSPRFTYLAENYVKRRLLRASSGWILLAGMAKRDLWSHLSAAAEEDEGLVELFLESLPAIEETGFVITPNVSEVGIEGIAVGVQKDGATVAAVACIGERAELVERADEIIGVLRGFSDRWQ